MICQLVKKRDGRKVRRREERMREGVKGGSMKERYEVCAWKV